MGTVTQIKREQGKDKNRVYLYIDYKYCTSLRERTWGYFNFSVGDEADCESIEEREAYIFKFLYDWDKEKVRLDYVEKWLKKYISDIDIKIVGFGADTNERILEHPEEKGLPDMTISLTETNDIIIYLEVTGTEYKRKNETGVDEYWIRPDKIEYIQKHQEKDIWVALHYKDTKQIIWIKPLLQKKYEYVVKVIKKVEEHYVMFYKDSEEVYSSQYFKDYIDNKVRLTKEKKEIKSSPKPQ